MDYKILLEDKRWKSKRDIILKRDKYKCRSCGKYKKPLHVHHHIYIEGCMPWDVPSKFLYTLCSVCHSLEHKISPIKRTTSINDKRIGNKDRKKIKKNNI
jgi:5-methylcytosine-specific restriction endonuclease McrA